MDKKQKTDIEAMKEVLRYPVMVSSFCRTLSQNAYFQSLPPIVRETIIQGHTDIRNEDELRACAENLMRQAEYQGKDNSGK